MRNRLRPVDALLALPRLADADERRASWRQAITLLGGTAQNWGSGVGIGPPPLDEVEPAELAGVVRVALEAGLADDMEFIDPGEAAVALYELLSALPAGRERRELGRRVFQRLYEGRAATFTAVATRMALGSGRSLDASTLRARVGIVMDMPIGMSVGSEALAFALVARRELLERWVAVPSMGALPARRMAAKLIEYAAREALTRAEVGDHYPRRVLVSEPVRSVFERLLADREPLVWRHAAIARGLLASLEPRLLIEIENGLDPALTPTSWRRSAVSLVAMLATDPEEGMQQCRGLLESRVLEKDPGLAATLPWGLSRVIELEPEVAATLIERLHRIPRTDVAESLAELLADVQSSSFESTARDFLVRLRVKAAELDSPVVDMLTRRALEQFDGDDSNVQSLLRRALAAYESGGAREAHVIALVAAQQAQREMAVLAALSDSDEASVRERIALLVDLDAGALERSRLHHLLLLGRRPGETDTSVPELERLYDEFGAWALDREERRGHEDEWSRSRALETHRRLRALLHLLDLETGGHGDAEHAAGRVKTRSRRALSVLLHELAEGPDGSVHRILGAAVARSIDSAVREGFAEPCDALLVLATFLSDQESIAAIAEASTSPEVQAAMTAYDAFLASSVLDPVEEDRNTSGGLLGPMPGETPREVLVKAKAVALLSRTLGGGSYRGEALRHVLLALGRALEVIASAHGLRELVDGAQSGFDPIAELENACDALKRLVAGARRRVLGESPVPPHATESAPLAAWIARAASGAALKPSEFTRVVAELVAGLPTALGGAIYTVASRLSSLPLAASSDVFAIPLERRRSALPDWLLPRRTIGAFYVVRALGSGGVSSVFMARRLEERNERAAEAFALKVPVYDPRTARHLSEREFMQLFREEAGALLSLPHHPNLARFVTFDLAARPKPILVMELIRGKGLDRLVRSRALTLPRALSYLDGVLAGLEAMHGVGLAHLDVKPSNIILRDDDTPVLVDFGLSGRKMRPGCGTLEYTAPEVLGVVPADHAPSAESADVYSFACTAYEVLTAELLFDAPDEVALMSQHVAHDGWPEKLGVLAAQPGLFEIASWLAACLRRDPRERPDATATRRALARLAPALSEVAWPLGSGSIAEAS